MTTERQQSWKPEWAVAPGEVLTEALADRGMTQAELARRTARPLKTISEIATGKAAITHETAIQLERALGISASLWVGLESRYREALARERAVEQLHDYVEWAEQFPIADLVRHGELPKRSTKPETAADLLGYFGVSSPAGWEQHWARVAAGYRMSGAHSASVHSLTAWLRWGEREAESISVASYDQDRFRDVLAEIKKLSRLAVFDIAVDRLTSELAATGVAVVVLPGLAGAPASGATRWRGGVHPVILLTLRYLTDDQFWYTVYHEAGHILLGRRRSDVVEDLDADVDLGEEHAADQFARNALLHAESFAGFVAAADFRRPSVRGFASEMGVSPGIVVGRLQHDGFIGSGQLNDLKMRYEPVR
jgi:addiction module HigA family antidote